MCGQAAVCSPISVALRGELELDTPQLLLRTHQEPAEEPQMAENDPAEPHYEQLGRKSSK